MAASVVLSLLCQLHAVRTGVQALVAALHDGAVDAGDEPGACDDAEQQPHDAGADAHHHVVEEEEVVEAVEGLPVGGGAGGGATGRVRLPSLPSLLLLS